MLGPCSKFPSDHSQPPGREGCLEGLPQPKSPVGKTPKHKAEEFVRVPLCIFSVPQQRLQPPRGEELEPAVLHLCGCQVFSSARLLAEKRRPAAAEMSPLWSFSDEPSLPRGLLNPDLWKFTSIVLQLQCHTVNLCFSRFTRQLTPSLCSEAFYSEGAGRVCPFWLAPLFLHSGLILVRPPRQDLSDVCHQSSFDRDH